LISQAICRSPFLVGQLLEWPACLYPDKPALEWEGGSLSFAKLIEAVKQCEMDLAACGAGQGQRWGLMLGNSPEFIVSLFALLRLGCVAVPLGCNLTQERLGSQVRLTRLDGILTCRDFVEGIRKLGWNEHGFLDKLSLFTLCDHLGCKSGLTPLVDLDPALILLTSGSTGRTRAVILQHHAILANLRSNIQALDLRDDDRTLIVLPLSHAYALVHQCLCHLMIGATVCLPPRTLVGTMMHAYLKSSVITTCSVVPPVLRTLVAGLKRSKVLLPALRLLSVGAAFADRQTATDFLSLLPHTRMAVTYGLTEAGPRVATHFVEPGELFNPECVGVPLPNVAIGFIELEDGTREIIVRSRSTTNGYWEQGGDHNGCGPNEALHTGDTGYISKGELHLKGRRGRVINRGGILVGAEQIESVLLAHPAIRSARVEAIEHPFWVEVPVAIITLAAGANSIDEGHLREYCVSRLSEEERPFRFVIQSSSEFFEPSKTQELASLVR
jgi:acyl-CoA synthetase (AMP-forming)/AMP-acid ligase II